MHKCQKKCIEDYIFIYIVIFLVSVFSSQLLFCSFLFCHLLFCLVLLLHLTEIKYFFIFYCISGYLMKTDLFCHLKMTDSIFHNYKMTFIDCNSRQYRGYSYESFKMPRMSHGKGSGKQHLMMLKIQELNSRVTLKAIKNF